MSLLTYITNSRKAIITNWEYHEEQTHHKISSWYCIKSLKGTCHCLNQHLKLANYCIVRLSNIPQIYHHKCSVCSVAYMLDTGPDISFEVLSISFYQLCLKITSVTLDCNIPVVPDEKRIFVNASVFCSTPTNSTSLQVNIYTSKRAYT